VIVLIPAYEPDERLLRLAERLLEVGQGLSVLVVDDGSGPEYAHLFRRAAAIGCTVIGHFPNRGKGFALKRGFEHAETHFPGQDVVCADCDGQHSVVDILRVARAVATPPAAVVLGARRFTGRVPLASRFGNTATRIAFARSTGRILFDTQTGLRGYPHSMLTWLRSVGGDRFEYELDLLLHASEADMTIKEVPIETIYLDGNASSHFRPLIDSARVYAPLMKFSLSSIVAFVVDVVVLFVMAAVTGNLLASVVTARVMSSNVNFFTNRRLVFGALRGRSVARCALRYFSLAASIMSANYLLMHLFHERAGAALALAKFATEALLFAASYQIQKRLVFASPMVATVTRVAASTRSAPSRRDVPSVHTGRSIV
jgi:putative flippase GtrA